MKHFLFSLFAFLFAVQSADASLTISALKQAATLAPIAVYDITVDIDPEGLKYSGHQKVTFTNRQEKSTNYLLFFIYPNDPALTKSLDPFLKVSNVRVNGAAAKSEEKGPSFRVYLPKALQTSQSVTVEFDFQAVIPQQSGTKDLFSEAMDQLANILNPTDKQPDYGIFSSNKDILNLGLWYVALSKFDQEGWDEEAYAGIGDVSYFDPSSFNVRISAPAAYQVVTTGSSIKKVPAKQGRLEHHVEAKLTRDFVVELSKQFEQKSAIRAHV